MDTEKVLPNDMRLNSYVEDYPEEIKMEIDEVRDKNTLCDPLDVDIEFETIGNLKVLASLAYALNERFVQQDDHRAYEAMYRGVVFAYQLTRMVQGEEASFDAGSYIGQLLKQPDKYDQLIRDTQFYLQDNDQLCEFLGDYVDELDGGRGYPHLAELAASVVFMLSERSLADKFLAESAKNATVEEFKSR